MPLIHVEWFERPDEKKAEFAAAIVRTCQDVLGGDPEDVEILFVDVLRTNWFVGGKSYALPLVE